MPPYGILLGNVVRGFSLVPHDPEESHYKNTPRQCRSNLVQDNYSTDGML